MGGGLCEYIRSYHGGLVGLIFLEILTFRIYPLPPAFDLGDHDPWRKNKVVKVFFFFFFPSSPPPPVPTPFLSFLFSFGDKYSLCPLLSACCTSRGMTANRVLFLLHYPPNQSVPCFQIDNRNVVRNAPRKKKKKYSQGRYCFAQRKWGLSVLISLVVHPYGQE